MLDRMWTIPNDHWLEMQEEMLLARVARRDTPWTQRRTSITVWLWATVTSGDPPLAPMIAGTSACGRRSTERALDSYTTMIRRSPPALIDIITAYAARLTRTVDGGAREI